MRSFLAFGLLLVVAASNAIYYDDERIQLEEGSVPPFDRGYPSVRDALIGDFPTWPDAWFEAVASTAEADRRRYEAAVRLLPETPVEPVRLDAWEIEWWDEEGPSHLELSRDFFEAYHATESPMNERSAATLKEIVDEIVVRIQLDGLVSHDAEDAASAYFGSFLTEDPLEAVYGGFADDAAKLIALMPDFRTDPRLLLLMTHDLIERGEDEDAFAAVVFADHQMQMEDRPELFDLAQTLVTQDRLRGEAFGTTPEEKRIDRLVLLDLEVQAEAVRNEREAYIAAMVEQGKVPGEPGFWDEYREYPRISETTLRERYDTLSPWIIGGIVAFFVITALVIVRVVTRVSGRRGLFSPENEPKQN